MSYGEITLDESMFLGNLIREIEPSGPIIEIGTLFGRSTLVITANKAREQRLITVDNYSWNPLGLTPDMHFRITNNVLFEAVKSFNLEILQLDKNDFYLTYKGKSPSLVFLDAIHSYAETKADI
jgi:cephalosporin hydroxylase